MSAIADLLCEYYRSFLEEVNHYLTFILLLALINHFLWALGGLNRIKLFLISLTFLVSDQDYGSISALVNLCDLHHEML